MVSDQVGEAATASLGKCGDRGSGSHLLWRDHPGGVGCHPPLDGGRLPPEHPHMTGIVGWWFSRNSEPEAAQEVHVESYQQVFADTRLGRAAVASGSVRRHRRTVARVAEHSTLGPVLAGLPVDGDHGGGDSPPQILVIPDRRIVTVRRPRASAGQAISERLQASVEQGHQVLEVPFPLGLAG